MSSDNKKSNKSGGKSTSNNSLSKLRNKAYDDSSNNNNNRKRHHSNNDFDQQHQKTKSNFIIQVSFTHIIIIGMVCIITGFYFGQAIQRTINWKHHIILWFDTIIISSKIETNREEKQQHSTILTTNNITSPPPDFIHIINDYIIPRTKNMIISDSNSDSNIINWTAIISNVANNILQQDKQQELNNNIIHEDSIGDIHKPIYQHLLVELSHIGQSYLESKDALTISMIELSNRCNLTLISYHCQELISSDGVSCLGMLMKGHKSLQTWPKQVIMTLDTFAPGLYSLIMTVPIIHEFFGIMEQQHMSSDERKLPVIVWSHKRRGIHHQEVIDPRDIQNSKKESNLRFMIETNLYHNDDNVTRAIFNALGDNGVLTSRLRESDHSYNDPAIYTFIDTLIDEGFESINIYSELYGRFDTRWTFFVGMKDFSSKSNWMKTESEIEIAIRHRIVSTISGGSPFQYFDGATMKSYEFIERVVENKWCIQFPERCKIGHGFDPEIPNVAQSMFDVGNSNIAIGGRGVFAKEYIKKGSYIGLEECVHGMFIPSMTYELMHNSAKHFENNNEFLQCLTIGYLDGYGDTCAGVDPGIFTFVNHGCNGSYNVGVPLNGTEATIQMGDNPREILDRSLFKSFHPFYERHFPQWSCEDFKAVHDIERGGELFDNYLVLGGEEGWEANLLELKDICSGKTGSVSQYEQGGLANVETYT